MTEVERCLSEAVQELIKYGLEKQLAEYITRFPDQISPSHLIGACKSIIAFKELEERYE